MKETLQYLFQGPFKFPFLLALAAFAVFVIGPILQIAIYTFETWLRKTWFGKSWICTTLIGQSILLFIMSGTMLAVMGFFLIYG